MSTEPNRNLVIVCEGGTNEPSYLESVRDFLIDQKVKVRIKISPLPPKESQQVFALREGAKKRELIKLDAEEEEKLKKYEIEDAYTQQPTRYIREAKLHLEDGVFEEAWAVFDKDVHPDHKRAFQLAKEWNVNIAFSSIAFEEWILLHFEYNPTAFEKSECRGGRNGGREIYNCGSNQHQEDCHGSKCISGYLITQNYFQSRIKDVSNLFHVLFDRVPLAFENSNALRLNLPTKPIYEINPYCDFDKLILTLFNLPNYIIWFEKEKSFTYEKIEFNIQFINEDILVRILNNQGQRWILNKSSFALIDKNREKINFGERKVLDPKEAFDIHLRKIDYQPFQPLFIEFSVVANTSFVCSL